MSINRDLKYLCPLLVEKWEAAQEQAHAQKLSVYIFEGFRTAERQQELYSRGRTTPGPIITNAAPFRSWHNFGLAIDVVFDGMLDRPGVQFAWNGDYKKLSKIMAKHGFQWSGRWNKLTGGLSGELCHFQINGGLTLGQAKLLYDKGGYKAVWEAVTKKIQRTVLALPFSSK